MGQVSAEASAVIEVNTLIENNDMLKVKRHRIIFATYFTHEWSCKKIISLWAFIVKRVFIVSSIASETSITGNGKVSAQNTVIAFNCRWKQDIQGEDINKTRKLIYTLIKLQ